jgi:hypothetical protein
MGVEDMSDEGLSRYYENVRKQVDADQGIKDRFMTGSSVKEYAERLRGEMIRRRLHHTPIDFSADHPMVKPEVASPLTERTEQFGRCPPPSQKKHRPTTKGHMIGTHGMASY